MQTIIAMLCYQLQNKGSKKRVFDSFANCIFTCSAAPPSVYPVHCSMCGIAGAASSREWSFLQCARVYREGWTLLPPADTTTAHFLSNRTWNEPARNLFPGVSSWFAVSDVTPSTRARGSRLTVPRACFCRAAGRAAKCDATELQYPNNSCSLFASASTLRCCRTVEVSSGCLFAALAVRAQAWPGLANHRTGAASDSCPLQLDRT